MADIEIHDAGDDLIEKAAIGPHRDWESISIEMEGTRFQRLHDLVASPVFELDDEIACVDTVEELLALAKSAGYADADNYDNMTKHLSDGDVERDAIIRHTGDLVSSPEGSLYFSLVRASEDILIKAASTGSARNFLTQDGDNRPGMLFASMLAAYEDGRNARLITENTTAFTR